jgi:putative selenate reductase
MGDKMVPVPISRLFHRITGEYREKGSIFGIPEPGFFRKRSDKVLSFFGGFCATPVGPAAGPHTQLSQNIIAAYLTGGRFFELKTVQKLDDLDLGKPCIDAPDEAYNTEWSTELTVEQAMKEYMNAWLVLHLLDAAFGLDESCRPGPSSGGGARAPFAFNMSVGYDLDGIKTEKIDSFIRQTADGLEGEYFQTAREELASAVEAAGSGRGAIFRAAGSGERSRLDPGVHAAELAAAVRAVPPQICSSVTLSTLHGCPPEEIEAICTYMIEEKKLNTLVKLNPTLLGYREVRKILDRTGFSHVTVKEETFSHDLQYPDAVEMLRRLEEKADASGVEFGIKLSNTLPSVNTKEVLPDEEMYMSGRPLFPITIRVASKLAADLQGEVPISYCGGVSVFNAEEIFACGIRPVTMATELLKPGGYVRMKQAAELFESRGKGDGESSWMGESGEAAASGPRGGNPGWDLKKIDVRRLQRLAEDAVDAEYAAKVWRGFDTPGVEQPLPLFDCYIAPCVEACPIRQDIPEYIRLTGEGRCTEALELILGKNPLPAITGSICDHQCMYNCTRLDYEGAVYIREMKRRAALCGERPPVSGGGQAHAGGAAGKGPEAPAKIAVVGAGPAGLSAAYFLARAGLAVTVFEKEPSAGGVVRHVLPRFRITEEALEQDIDFIASFGVEFRFGVPADIGPDRFTEEGYDFICLAVGAEKEKEFTLPGGNGHIIGALEMLRQYNRDPKKLGLGGKAAVVGGGNTAMDSARAAAKTPGVEEVTVYYRRTETEMPADREEYENCLEDGVVFEFLAQPESYAPDGTLTVRRMRLGEEDESGRRRPLPTGETWTVRADTVIAAVGEEADREVLQRFGLEPDESEGKTKDETPAAETPSTPGADKVFLLGDARTGPSTVVECIAEGRRVADAVLERLGAAHGGAAGSGAVQRSVSSEEARRDWSLEGIRPDTENVQKRYLRRHLLTPEDLAGPTQNPAEPVKQFAGQEAERCLECNILCNKCVEVCPNRANAAVPVPPELGFRDRYQILHIDGYCNECGNCGTFCPYNGNPYLDKLTLFNSEEEFRKSGNPGFFIEDGSCTLRAGEEARTFRLEDGGGGAEKAADAWARAAGLVRHICRNHGYLLGDG